MTVFETEHRADRTGRKLEQVARYEGADQLLFVDSVEQLGAEDIVAFRLRREVTEGETVNARSEDVDRHTALEKVGCCKLRIGEASRVTSTARARRIGSVAVVIVGNAVTVTIGNAVVVEVGSRVDAQRERQLVFANAETDRFTFRTRVDTRNFEGPARRDEGQVALQAENAAVLFLRDFDVVAVASDREERTRGKIATGRQCERETVDAKEVVVCSSTVDAVRVGREVTRVERVVGGCIDGDVAGTVVVRRDFGAGVVRFEERREVHLAGEGILTVCHDVVEVLAALESLAGVETRYVVVGIVDVEDAVVVVVAEIAERVAADAEVRDAGVTARYADVAVGVLEEQDRIVDAGHDDRGSADERLTRILAHADFTVRLRADDCIVTHVDRTDFAGIGDFVFGVAAREEVAVTQANGVAVIVFGAEADEAAVEVDAVGCADGVVFTCTLRVDFATCEEFEAVEVLAQDNVTHTGNCVRTVDRRSTVEQQVVAVDKRARQQVDRRARRRAFHTGGSEAAAVEQEEGTVCTEAAQVQRLRTGAVIEDEALEGCVDLLTRCAFRALQDLRGIEQTGFVFDFRGDDLERRDRAVGVALDTRTGNDDCARSALTGGTGVGYVDNVLCGRIIGGDAVGAIRLDDAFAGYFFLTFGAVCVLRICLATRSKRERRRREGETPDCFRVNFSH